jgi:lambda family phage portal protein
MKLLNSIRAFGMRCLVAAMIVVNRYEAGQRWGTGRSFLPAGVQDARFDADDATRTEIVRKARYFERNNALVNRLADLFEQYTVGHCGLQIIPNSSSEDWNQAAKEWFDEWSKFCDLTSLQTFSTIQSLVARSWFIDGEIFILKTNGESRDKKTGEPNKRPRIQLIESHRVATPSNLSASEGRKIIDGIEIDDRGRPVAYHVRDGFDEESYRRIPAERIIHVFEPSRAGQYRGLPFLYPVLNDLHDLDDLEILEMRAAKDAAEKSTFITTASGELNADVLRSERYGQSTQNSSGTDTSINRTKFIRDAIGGRVAALKIGETVEQFIPNRPSVAAQWYWDYLTSKICAGTGISKLLVYPWSMQGTVTRADLDVMNGFFRSRSGVLASAFVQVWEYVIGWAIGNDPRVADGLPADWRNVTTRAPRSVNVDVGRNSAATIAEYEAKLRTADSIFSELGCDWRQEFKQIAKEEAFKMALEKQFGLPPGAMSKAVKESLEAEAEKAKSEKEAIAA